MVRLAKFKIRQYVLVSDSLAKFSRYTVYIQYMLVQLYIAGQSCVFELSVLVVTYLLLYVALGTDQQVHPHRGLLHEGEPH